MKTSTTRSRSLFARRFIIVALGGIFSLSVLSSAAVAAPTAPTPEPTNSSTAAPAGSAEESYTSATEPSTEASAAAIENLPAWRWTSVEIDGDTGGWLGVIKQFPILICTLLLAISQFIWQLLLGIMKFSIDAGSLVKPGAPFINAGVSTLGNYVLGITIIFWAFVLWKVVKAIIKGRIGEALRTGGTFLVLFALLSVVVSTSSAAAKDTNTGPNQVLATGTMPWLAETVATFSTDLTGQLADAKNMFGLGEQTTGFSNAQGNNPTCTQYINVLHKNYADSVGSNHTYISMSSLWEQTQYRAWGVAAFGTQTGPTDLGSRVMCHWAEAVNGVSPEKQQAIAAKAYPGALAAASTGTAAVFGPYSKEDRRRAMTAWAACDFNTVTKKWQTSPEFIGVWSDSPTGDDYGNSHCGMAFSTSGRQELEGGFGSGWDSFNLFAGRIADAFERDGQTSVQRQAMAPAKAWASGFSGANTSDRLLQGFLSVIVAALFFYALGFVAIGTFLAQLMLVALLIFSPLMLALFAVGSPKAKSLAKLTGTTMVSQAFFSLLLTILVSLSDLFQSLFVRIPGFAGSGIIRTLLFGLAPLMAFFIVRKALQSIGMADILRPSGAVTFLASAAAVATGDAKIAKLGLMSKNAKGEMENGLTGRLKALPGIGKGLQSLDGASPHKQNWSKEGRQIRRGMREEKDAQLRARMGQRLSKDQMSKKDKLSNWMDARSLSDDRLGKNLRRGALLAPLGVGAAAFGIGAIAAGALGSVAGLGGTLAGLDVAGLATAAGGASLAHSLHQRFRLGPVPLSNADTSVDVNTPSYVSAATATGKSEFQMAGFTRALRANPGDSESIMNYYVASRLDSSRLFKDVESVQELSGARLNLADRLNVRYDQIDVSSSGLMVPAFVANSELRNVPPELLQNFVYHLPENERGFLPNETASDRAERLTIIGHARGFILEDGTNVDALSKIHGIDINAPEGRSEIQAWQEGAEHKTLGKRVAKGTNSKLEAQLLQTVHSLRARSEQAQLQLMATSAADAYAELEIDLDTSAITSALDAAVRDFDTQLNNQSGLSQQINAARAANDVKQTDAIAEKMRAVGKEVENSFAKLRTELMQVGETNAQLTLDTLLALNTFSNADEYTDAVLREFETIASDISGLESLIPAAYAGNQEALREVQRRVTEHSNAQKSSVEKLAREISGIKVASNEAADQLAAVQRRTRTTRTMTTKELLRAMEAQEFPA